MITDIEIENYKSIGKKLHLPLGKINVFIGENGAGKSNVLEAIALSAAAACRRLDNEFLSARGIRVTKPEDMRSGFDGVPLDCSILLDVKNSGAEHAHLELTNDGRPYSKWKSRITFDDSTTAPEVLELARAFERAASSKGKSKQRPSLDDLVKKLDKSGGISIRAGVNEDGKKSGEFVVERFFDEIDGEKSGLRGELGDFVIYSPENSALRIVQRDGQMEPLGINGEGVLKLVSVLSDRDPEALQRIKSSLKLLGWFDDLQVPKEALTPSLEVMDVFVNTEKRFFDSASANEGFLFLLFYFLLFTSDLTPKFFAVDNIDASLNPKLCERLVRELVSLSAEHGKQCILTTHNPAVLDGLNLDDDDQRLFVISRAAGGTTRVRRIMKPATETPRRLSEMFTAGILGGLPKNF